MLQILCDPIRQELGRVGVLASVQSAIDHYVGFHNIRTLELSTEILDLVFQKETNILRGCDS